MRHLHDELSDMDMKFLEKFDNIENHKENVDEADPEGIEQAKKHKGPKGEAHHEDVDPIHGEFKAPNVGDHDGSHDQEGGQGEGGEKGDAEGQGEGEGEQGEGDDSGNTEGGDQGQGENSDGDGEGEDGEGEEDGDGDGEGEDERKNDDRGDGKPECDGDCDDSEQEEGEECPYCKEKEQRQQQQQENEENGEGDPIALDSNGDPIKVGDEIRSKGDGHSIPDDACEYVGVVMGRAYGWDWDGERDPNDISQIEIVVFRRDRIGEDAGNFYVEGEGERTGWGVRSDLTTLVKQEQDEQQEQKQQEKREALCKDCNGVELFDGDEVIVVEPNDVMGFPEDGILTVRKDCTANESGIQWPCLVPLNYDIADMDTDWGTWTYDGKKCYTFNTSPAPEFDFVQKHERKDEEKEEEMDNFEFEAPPDEEKKPLTKTQKERFKNLCERIFKKSEQTFGSTIETDEIGPDLPGGIFDGEEVAKVYEVKSRGVVYRISVSAERYE